MKLLVTGATGFVGSEVIRQALRNSAITSVVALARKPVLPPENAGPGADTYKLQSVILEDWTSPYPESVQAQLKGADACIWNLGIGPTKAKGMDFADVTKISADFTINGLTNIAAVANRPFRFVYTSGVTVERDQSKTLPYVAEYRLMRGRVENQILDFGNLHAPDVQVTVTKPGCIDGPGREPPSDAMIESLFKTFGHTPVLHVSELSVAMIDQCLNGITKDPLWSKDLLEIAQRVISEEDYLR